jgi:hypothetical protein
MSVNDELFVVALSTIEVLDDSLGHTRFASSFQLRHGNYRYYDWNHEGDGWASCYDSLCQMPNVAASYHHYLFVTEEAPVMAHVAWCEWVLVPYSFFCSQCNPDG